MSEAQAEPDATPGAESAPIAGPSVPVQSPGAPPRPQLTGFPLREAFGALEHRNFRLFYGGQVVSLTGTWMQTTAQGWLVLELTDSELLLGAVTAAGALPVLLFTLYAGELADRRDKRAIIVASQCVALLVALALAILTDTGYITVGWILALVFVLGVANAFDLPARQSFLVDLVGKQDLTNAIALNSAAFNLTRIVGPAIAGFLIAGVGIAACFYVNSFTYMFIIAGLIAIERPPFRAPPRTASTFENLREGFAFVWRDPLARTLVGLVAAASILALPYVMLLPVFARDVLDVGARGLGWLLAATGAGALSGALGLAAASRWIRRGPLLLCSSIGFCLAVTAFSLSGWFPLSLLLLATVGFTFVPFAATVDAVIQSIVPDQLRGRVMGVYIFMFLGMTPIGSLQAGALADWLGAPIALSIGAVVMLALVLIAFWRVPQLREVV